MTVTFVLEQGIVAYYSDKGKRVSKAEVLLRLLTMSEGDLTQILCDGKLWSISRERRVGLRACAWIPSEVGEIRTSVLDSEDPGEIFRFIVEESR